MEEPEARSRAPWDGNALAAPRRVISAAARTLGTTLLAAAAGMLSALAFPPFGWLVATWLGPLTWLVLLERARRAAWTGLAFGCGLVGMGGAWLPSALADRFETDSLVAWALYGVAVLSYAGGFALLGVGLRGVPRGGTLFPAAAGVGWCCVELSHLYVWPRLPAVALAAPLIDTPMAAAAASVGVHGVSGLVAASSAVLADIVRRGGLPAPRAALPALAVGAAWLISVAAGGLGASGAATRTALVAAVQPGVPLTRWAGAGWQRAQLDALFELTEGRTQADLIVWPENALGASLEARPERERRVARLSRRLGTRILLGAQRLTRRGRASSALLFDAAARPAVLYDKRRLLPFAESEPPLLGWLMRRGLGGLRGRLVAGVAPGVVALGPLRVELAICHEAIFSGRPEDARAALILNPASDAWLDRTPAPRLHLLLARWRAIERAAPLVRASSTGISALVDADGAVLASARLGERSVLQAPLAISSRVTPFERVGYLPTVGAAAAIVCAVRCRRPIRAGRRRNGRA